MDLPSTTFKVNVSLEKKFNMYHIDKNEIFARGVEKYAYIIICIFVFTRILRAYIRIFFISLQLVLISIKFYSSNFVKTDQHLYFDIF